MQNPEIAVLQARIQELEAQLLKCQPDIGLTNSKSAIVNRKAFWIPVGPKTPIGSKCLLIVKADRNALLGQYTPKSNWTHYYPLPAFDPAEVS